MKVVGSLILKHFVDNSANDKSSFYRLTVSSEVGYDCRFSKFTAFDKAYTHLHRHSCNYDIHLIGPNLSVTSNSKYCSAISATKSYKSTRNYLYKHLYFAIMLVI